MAFGQQLKSIKFLILKLSFHVLLILQQSLKKKRLSTSIASEFDIDICSDLKNLDSILTNGKRTKSVSFEHDIPPPLDKRDSSLNNTANNSGKRLSENKLKQYPSEQLSVVFQDLKRTPRKSQFHQRNESLRSPSERSQSRSRIQPNQGSKTIDVFLDKISRPYAQKRQTLGTINQSGTMRTQSKIDDTFKILKQRIKDLQVQLKNTKIFLNMVIHDMRNPTNSIDFALKEIIKILRIDNNKNNNKPGWSIEFIKSINEPNTEKEQQVTVKDIDLEGLKLNYQQESSDSQNIIMSPALNNMNNQSYNEEFLDTYRDLDNVSERSNPPEIPEIQLKANKLGENCLLLPNQERVFLYSTTHQAIYRQESDDMSDKSPDFRRGSQKLEFIGSVEKNNSYFKDSKSHATFGPFNLQLIMGQENTRESAIRNSGEIFEIYQAMKSPETEQYLKNSLMSTTMLLNLINDLLDLAKIENSQFNLNSTYFNLFESIQKSIETLDYQIHQKNIKVHQEIQEENIGFFLQIYGDSNRYQQILLNFMSNALKFTPQNGNITITTILKAFQDIKSSDKNTIRRVNNNKFAQKRMSDKSFKKKFKSQDHSILLQEETLIAQKYIDFEIRIKDSGCGIQKANLEKLFMNFSKLEEHNQMNERGTGLGLSICKSLVELMGGSVSVESEVGVGTTFIMSLKTKCIMASQKSTQDWLNKVLGKEPEQKTFNHQISFQNMHYQNSQSVKPFMRDAYKGYKSHSIYEEEKQDDQFNQIVVHPQTPEYHGRVLNINHVIAQKNSQNCFQRLPYWQNKQPIDDLQSQSSKMRKNCVSVDEHLGNKNKTKVLVANDDQFQLMIISKTLQYEGCVVEEAENGMVAVNKAYLRTYDAILLDLDMPIMNGYEACAKLKQYFDGQGLKDLVAINKVISESREDFITKRKQPVIIALSALINSDIADKCLKAGFDKYLETPLTPEKIRKVIMQKIEDEEDFLAQLEQIEISQTIEQN